MPNDCENRLNISHKDKNMITKIEKLLSSVEEAGGRDYSPFLETLVPLPSDLEEDSMEAYQWRWINWGTKWEIYSVSPISMQNEDSESDEEDEPIVTKEKDGKYYLEFRFLSAWNPPIEGYRYLIKQGYDIDAWYCEMGKGFCGTFEKNIDKRYDIYDDKIPKKLDDFFQISSMLKNEDDQDEDQDGLNKDDINKMDDDVLEY